MENNDLLPNTSGTPSITEGDFFCRAVPMAQPNNNVQWMMHNALLYGCGTAAAQRKKMATA